MVVAANWMLDHADGQPPRPSSEPIDFDTLPEIDATGLSVGVLFDRLLDAVVIAKLTTGRIVAWNPAAERLFGYTAREAIGQSIEVLMPEPITRIHRAGIERYMRTGHGLIVDADSPVEMPGRTKADEQIRIEMSLSELRNARGERFAMAVMRDAMHRKRLELTSLELAQAQVARSETLVDLAIRDDLIEAITAEVAALAATAGPSDLTQSSGPSDALASVQLERLTEALLEYRRLRNGELSFRPMNAELVDVVHAAVDAARRQANGRRLLVFTVPSVPAVFDPTRTRQMLGYLLEEVIARSRDGSNIEVHVDQPSPHVAELRLRYTPAAREPAGVGIQLARALAQRQKGSLSIASTSRGTASKGAASSGGVEVVLTLPGRPHPARRKPSRGRPRRERVSVP